MEKAHIHDAIVVGAGLAGLVAARDLSDRDLDVVVLEARNRVGGRTFSSQFPGRGTVVDLGAEWVSRRHVALIAELTRYGVELRQVPDDGTSWRFAGEVRTGELPVSAEAAASIIEIFGVLSDHAAELRGSGPNLWEPPAEVERSFGWLLTDRSVPPEAQAALEALGYSLMGATPHEYSTSALVAEVARFGGSPEEAFQFGLERISGGADSVSIRMAEDLDVRLEHVVVAIQQSADRVLARLADGSEFHARALVLAVPLNVMADIELSPPPGGTIDRLRHQGHAGRAVKIWAEANGLPPHHLYMGHPAPLEAYTIASEDGTTLLGAFSLADDFDSINGPLVEDRVRDFCAEITVGRLIGHDWLADPFAKGTWLAPRPGQWTSYRAFWQPDRRLAFAGGDIDRDWAGWMEGAVRSGRSAADDVTAILARNGLSRK